MGDLQENAWGIPEPVDAEEVEVSEIDAVLAPLLVVDKQGNRVGYGKGFYDRFFAACRPDVKRLGLSYFEPVENITDVHGLDVPIQVLFSGKTLFLKVASATNCRIVARLGNLKRCSTLKRQSTAWNRPCPKL